MSIHFTASWYRLLEFVNGMWHVIQKLLSSKGFQFSLFSYIISFPCVFYFSSINQKAKSCVFCASSIIVIYFFITMEVLHGLFILTILALNIPPSSSRRLPSLARTTNSTLCPAVAECVAKLDAGETCGLLPIPPQSLFPSPSTGNFLLTNLRRGVWAYSDGAHQSLLLFTGKRLAVVDFPDASTTLLIAAVQQTLRTTIPDSIDMIYSHGHYDHIGGATRFHTFMKETYPSVPLSIYGTADTSRFIFLSESKRAIRPNKIIGRTGRILKLSKNLEVRMTILGGHTDTDVFIHIPRVDGEQAVAMLVDVVFPRWSPFTNLAITNDPGDYLRAHDDILKFDFDIFMGGHVNIGDRQDVVISKEFTEDLFEAGAIALQSVTQEDFVEAGIAKVGDPNAVEFGNLWFAIIAVVRRLQSEACYRIMIEKWGCRVAGLDLTLSGHCFYAVTWNSIGI